MDIPQDFLEGLVESLLEHRTKLQWPLPHSSGNSEQYYEKEEV